MPSQENKYDGQIVSEKEALAKGKSVVQIWLDKISAAREEEHEWRKSAQRAADVYEASKDQSSAFNIYHANVETIIPALYNSTPIPDVRRRYDPDTIDEAEFAGLPEEQAQMAMQQAQQQIQAEAKLHKRVAELTERCLSYSVDQYDFDNVMEDCVRDCTVTGRGVVRVRYVPTIDGDDVHEEALAELVPWNRFIRGPGISWEATPFIAFHHDLTREQVERLVDDPARLPALGFHSSREDDEGEPKPKPDKGVLKTLETFEIWDRVNKSVLFITPQDKNKPLLVERDPLGLSKFFPVPKPLQTVRRLASQVPVCPYDVYEPLIQEINHISRRIASLIKQLRVIGLYDPKMAPDFERLRDAEDGLYVPCSDSDQFVQGSGGGLEKAVLHWPVEQIIKVVDALYIQREQIKQTIYEVMGVSDILRGQVDPREKLGQSQIKEQSGSRRLQRSQSEVARLAEDVFVMKGEIMHRKFSPQSLERMSSMRVTPEMHQQMRSDMRGYSINIETDSTVRADMAKYQEELNSFLQGTAQIAQATTSMAPVMPAVVPPMLEVFASFARKFNLGKQGEDALERLSEAAKEPIRQPDDGQAEAAKAEADARMQEMQVKSQQEAEKHQHDMQLKQADLAIKQQDMAHKREMADLDREMKLFDLHAKQTELGMRERELSLKAQTAEADAERDAEGKERDAAHQERMAEIKERQAVKPKNGAGG